ncbi:MAG: NAD(P)/FAD-dependent oxidoreductase [Pseudomonadota bacterium]|nr:NAD(P)/FAD-dependent oxidoreductase [Pseudomonadota bacterium]
MGHRPGTGADLSGRHFDVACVGCGPAGNLSAWLLARAGHSVLLLDRAALPRQKTCGGGLSARALALLPFPVDAVVHRHMQGARLSLAGRLLADIDSAAIGAMIERAEFDRFMSLQAQAAGAELWPQTALEDFSQDAERVQLRTSRGNCSARLLIGADGAHSPIRRRLFARWKPRWAFGIEARFSWPAAGPAQALPLDRALFDFAALRQGYGWIFPKRDHFNVGVYRLHKTAATSGLRAQLARFAGLHGGLSACQPDAAVGHPIPLSTGRQPVALGRVVLVGDAAGLGEAFLGEGIAFALDSATRAAAWASHALLRNAAPSASAYRRALAPLISELHYSLRIAQLLYRLPQPILQGTAAHPAVQRLVIDLLRGQRSYRSTFWALLWRVPSIMLGRRAPAQAH